MTSREGWLDADIGPDLTEALASGVRPENVDGLDEALAILPIFGLCRSLFSTSPTDSALKLVILFALCDADGRYGRERIRTLVPGIAPDRLDALVTSLYGGGWLELRASDNTYRTAPLGFYLLAVLRAGNFASQSPANLLVRAVETLAFGDRVDDGGSTTPRLLGMLLGELETQAERARDVLRRGRPRELMRFSRSEVKRQVEHVVQVIAAIEERLDEASAEFSRVVRIHEAMQVILRAHQGLADRLAEWNLRKLETTDAGYSLSALCDAVMGASDAELERAIEVGALVLPAPVRCISTDEVMSRHVTARRTGRVKQEPFVYEPPPEPEPERWAPEQVDPVARLRAILMRVASDLGTGESVSLGRWLPEIALDFADAVFQLSLLAHLQGRAGDGGIAIGEGLVLRLAPPPTEDEAIRGLSPEQALTEWLRCGVLERVDGRGLHGAVRLVREEA